MFHRSPFSFSAILFSLLVCSAASPALAQPGSFGASPERSAPVPETPATPAENDANLHDVQFVGSQMGWAVGDRGVIWHTSNGGVSWKLQRTGVTCSLRSVCFLTNQVGWVVGGGFTPHTGQEFGVFLATQDGGKTWTQPATKPLPGLHHVKFFGLNQGIAAGASSVEVPTGILKTQDGGKTWQPVPGPYHSGWRAAAFRTPDQGVVAGKNGKALMVGSGRLLPSRFPQQELRTFRSVALSDRRGWLVGDGGFVQRSSGSGSLWEAPPAPLPPVVEAMMDFRTVCTKGTHTWIAGSPGRVIWHTPDDGRTWEKQLTPQTVPINRMTFQNEMVGWTVGDLGTMLQTVDGGRTWTATRAEGRHVALLALAARPQRISFPLLSKQAGDLGYRSYVLLPARTDLSAEQSRLDLRVQAAVTHTGGAGAELGWQFPVDRPDLAHDPQKLIGYWNEMTEGKFAQVFLAKLVVQLRTWKPSVIVIDGSTQNDATAKLIQQAVLQAVQDAANPVRYTEFARTLHLAPWQVQKVYLRLAPGSHGHANVDVHHYLPRLQSSPWATASPALSLVDPNAVIRESREAYQLIYSAKQSQDQLGYRGDFFQGIPMMPGGPARRALQRIDEAEYERQRKLIQRQKNFRGIVEHYRKDPRHAAQLIAQLRETVQGMNDAQAAMHLSELADEYRAQAQWGLYEAALVELIHTYPKEPVTHQAMKTVLQFWGSTEIAWLRSRNVQVGHQRLTVDRERVLNRIQQASHLATTDPLLFQPEDLGPDPVSVLQHAGGIHIGPEAKQSRGIVNHWQTQAIRMASFLRDQSPELYLSPEVQFPLSSLMKKRNNSRLADRLTQRYLISNSGGPWRKIAEAENWLSAPNGLSPTEAVTCQPTLQRPTLDGILSDACWQRAEEIKLKNPKVDGQDVSHPTPALVMMAYDRQYLYLAASVPRVRGVRTDGVNLSGRGHDADLASFDRITLHLDLDRDYTTTYAFQIDQRGWTAESCWGNSTWNPKWHVAADSNESHWRIEIAIPFAELASSAPQRNTVWAVGISRTIPSVGWQSWTQAPTATVRPELFGLVKFE